MKKNHITTIIVITVALGAVTLPAMASADASNQASFQKAKTTLTDTLNRLEVHFQKTRDKAAALKQLTEVTGTDIVQIIDNYLAQIGTLKTKVADAQTAEDLKAAAKEIHSLILDAKADVKKNISKRVEVRITRFTQKTARGQALIQSAQLKLDQLKNEGKDIQAASASLQSCQQLLQQGEAKLNEAKGKFQEVENSASEEQEQSTELMKQGMETVKEARDTYSQARQNCSEMMKELRSLK